MSALSIAKLLAGFDLCPWAERAAEIQRERAADEQARDRGRAEIERLDDEIARLKQVHGEGLGPAAADALRRGDDVSATPDIDELVQKRARVREGLREIAGAVQARFAAETVLRSESRQAAADAIEPALEALEGEAVTLGKAVLDLYARARALGMAIPSGKVTRLASSLQNAAADLLDSRVVRRTAELSVPREFVDDLRKAEPVITFLKGAVIEKLPAPRAEQGAPFAVVPRLAA